MSQRLTGKVAIITGGSKGIGFATARRFAQEGAAVVITARNETEGNKAATAINQEFPDSVKFKKQDVSNSERWTEILPKPKMILDP